MRFALVGPVAPYRGGISQYNTSLYRELAQAHEVLPVSFSRLYPHFFFPGRSQEEPESVATEEVGERLLDTLNPLSWLRTSRAILDFSCDAVIFQWWRPFFSLAYWEIARRLRSNGITSLFVCHNVFPHEGSNYPGFGWPQRRLIQLAFNRADVFLVHSRGLGQQVREFCPQARIRHVFHPVYDFYRRWDPGRPPGEDGSHLLFFGKVRAYKGLEVLIRALAWLSPELDFRVTVAGEFYIDPQPFRRLADRLGVAERIRWQDRYIENEQVPAIFRSADLVVLPYLKATQSGVVPLAYYFDLPVIASNVGGLSEVVKEGKTGYLFRAGDSRQLADRITTFLTHRRREPFRRHIRAFKARLSWQQVVDGIVSEVAGGRKGSPAAVSGSPSAR